ncbi:OadG family transporter subunit [Alcanivorax sp.]|uniref:OadG family protein n=1 Tax=Alcanivorax sp. TaxID=1872427 RepID=UPI0032D980AB
MNAMMAQGVELMLVGMGVVFVFLIVLVAVTTAMSALVRKFGREPQASTAQPVPSLPQDLPPPAIIKAIEKAVQQHRQSSLS